MAEFRMPSLGADMTEGTLLSWRVQVGDRVKRGDIIAEVATDKGDIEVEVFDDGVVTEILVEEGTEVPVGTVLAKIDGQGEEPASPEKTPPADATPRPPARAPRAPSPAPHEASAGVRLRATPLARRLAAEAGLRLSDVEGTGPDGAITREDVERARGEMERGRGPAQEGAAGPRRGEGLRRAIAAAMSRSNRDIPHYYLETRVDMKRALDFLAAENGRRPLERRLLPVVLLLKAVARSLEAVPELNGHWVDDGLRLADGIHIGFAVALRGGGLVTPAIHDVPQKSLDELMAALSELVPRARAGRLRGSEMTDGTVTVTSLGDLGVETVHGVIYPPQVALVGFGKILERPWAVDGMLDVRPVVSATLAGDHRATDGLRGARFLDTLKTALQRPDEL